MKVKVKLFATLREVFGGEEKVVELKDGSNIQDLLGALCRYHCWYDHCYSITITSQEPPKK